MTDINILFSRQLLKGTHAEVRRYFPHVNVVKDTGIVKMSSSSTTRIYWCFELVYDGKYYSTEIVADNAYEARSKGWEFVIMACSAALADFARDLVKGA